MAGLIKDIGKLIEYNGKSREGRNGSRGKLNVTNEFLEHFNGASTIPPGLVLTNEGSAVTAAAYGAGLGGTAVITSDDVTAKSASLNGVGLLWEADRQTADQPLVYEIKVKVGTLTGREFWFGLSDALTDTDPIALSLTSTFTTSVPTDGVYIGYSDTPTSGAAFLSGGNSHTAISIKTDVNTIVSPTGGTGAAFVTDTYYTYRIEVDKNGNAAFFINGKFFCAKAAALTKTVPLTHVAYGVPRATAGSSEAVYTVDYIYCGGI